MVTTQTSTLLPEGSRNTMYKGEGPHQLCSAPCLEAQEAEPNWAYRCETAAPTPSQPLHLGGC